MGNCILPVFAGEGVSNNLLASAVWEYATWQSDMVKYPDSDRNWICTSNPIRLEAGKHYALTNIYFSDTDSKPYTLEFSALVKFASGGFNSWITNRFEGINISPGATDILLYVNIGTYHRPVYPVLVEVGSQSDAIPRGDFNAKYIIG